GRPSTDLDTVIGIGTWLNTNIERGPGLSESSDKALELMMSSQGGVCSDMAQIFNNFCVLNDILVREWGTTTAPFNRAYGGHSFNEVFYRELDQWGVIDVYSGVLFKNQEGSFVSVLELYKLIRQNKPFHYHSFVNKKIKE